MNLRACSWMAESVPCGQAADHAYEVSPNPRRFSFARGAFCFKHFRAWFGIRGPSGTDFIYEQVGEWSGRETATAV